MKRLLPAWSALIAASVFLFSASSAHARELCPGGFTTLCQIKLENSGGIIGAVMTVFFIIAILTSLFFMIFGAYKWVTSAGDQGKTASARSTIISALVGLVIALSVFFIVNIVLTVFTGQGLAGLTVPKLVK